MSFSDTDITALFEHSAFKEKLNEYIRDNVKVAVTVDHGSPGDFYSQNNQVYVKVELSLDGDDGPFTYDSQSVSVEAKTTDNW